MQEITSQLHITDAQSARKLPPDHPFDEVVTLGYFDSMGYSRPEQSTTGDDLVFPDGPHDYEKFEAAVQYVLDALARGDQVLVHCQAGISRSCGVCSVALTEREDLSLPDAYAKVRDAREIVNPGPEIQESMERYTGEKLVPAPRGYNA